MTYWIKMEADGWDIMAIVRQLVGELDRSGDDPKWSAILVRTLKVLVDETLPCSEKGRYVLKLKFDEESTAAFHEVLRRSVERFAGESHPLLWALELAHREVSGCLASNGFYDQASPGVRELYKGAL